MTSENGCIKPELPVNLGHIVLSNRHACCDAEHVVVLAFSLLRIQCILTEHI